MLLNGSPFMFVIDLAALASRREYLKLDKWLKDKLKEHQVRVVSTADDRENAYEPRVRSEKG